MPGTSHFNPPANSTPKDLNVRFTADGLCSGKLNGEPIEEVSVKVLHTAVSPDGTCSEAHSRGGHGAITFPSGQVVRYRIDFDSLGTNVEFRFRGERSGTGTGTGSFLTQRTNPDVLLRCQTEEGVSATPLDVTLETDTPLVSSRRAGGGGNGGGQGNDGARKRRRHLRLKVRPRRARAGRRTVFRFRVTTNKGRRKTGAKVRFAGRTATTRRGKARIVARFRRRGTRMARATRPGYGSARRAVVIR